jgi:hypothetical protein
LPASSLLFTPFPVTTKNNHHRDVYSLSSSALFIAQPRTLFRGKRPTKLAATDFVGLMRDTARTECGKDEAHKRLAHMSNKGVH